ncbi:MAG TPA: histidine kinase [Gaiellaceae bacterium]|jgi:signal transduction histidine kinase|nr:histidine kinase [Gaiellaceae bacterium]
MSRFDLKWLVMPWYAPAEGHLRLEVIVMRLCGTAWLVSVLVQVLRGDPRPGLHGRGVVVLTALVALYAFAVWSRPWTAVATRARIVALAGVTVAGAVLAALQPDAGTWPTAPLLVGLIAAWCLQRRAAVLTLAFSVGVLVTVAVSDGHSNSVVAILTTAVPWFLIVRLLRELGLNRDALELSRAAEAEAAAEAERARLAREMHDILAHSLSALALQLESARLLAVRQGIGGELTRAIDRAHQLAATGLHEARSAVAAARGDELPGPDRIGALAGAFAQQSGLPVDVAVKGEPRPLAPDARLTVYRTVQEALTNIRRHATPEHVTIELSYRPDDTVVVIEDRAPVTAPALASVGLLGAGGYGLTGMRERAELLGGELTAEATGNGFRVELRLPA